MQTETLGFLNRFLLRHWPSLAMRLFAKKIGIKNIIFNKAHELLYGVDRIDFFPSYGDRGFVLVVDRKTALFFCQNGDHFEYDGFEMGPYAKGDVTVLDGIDRKPPLYP